MSSYFKSIFKPSNGDAIKLVVFDFDGTLADTRALVLGAVKKHLLRLNYDLSKGLVKKFGDKPLYGFLELAGVKKYMVKDLTELIHQDYQKNHKKVKPCKNLYKLKEIDKRKVILSNNNSKFITASLKSLKANFFIEVYGCDNCKNKIDGMRIIMKKYNVSPEQIVYVGDRAMDILVSKKIGCYHIAVSNKASWSKRKDIMKQHPDFIISHLGQIKEIIENLEFNKLSAV